MSIRESLLALLAEGPTHGFALKKAFEARTGGMWPLNVGQVYTTLGRLVRDGAVAELPGSDDGQKRYETGGSPFGRRAGAAGRAGGSTS